mmetsp:Transcript_2/g.4  ORF Transcript_2/g.4 Transcript_2/m.4 type:complete len:233 (-) Transcript_2:761-1459(-)
MACVAWLSKCRPRTASFVESTTSSPFFAVFVGGDPLSGNWTRLLEVRLGRVFGGGGSFCDLPDFFLSAFSAAFTSVFSSDSGSASSSSPSVFTSIFGSFSFSSFAGASVGGVVVVSVGFSSSFTSLGFSSFPFSSAAAVTGSTTAGVSVFANSGTGLGSGTFPLVGGGGFVSVFCSFSPFPVGPEEGISVPSFCFDSRLSFAARLASLVHVLASFKAFMTFNTALDRSISFP